MKPLTLLEAWTATVRAAPGAPALTEASSGRVWRRCELDAIAGAWQAKHGAEAAGRTVVFALPNGAEWMALFLGLLKSGSAAVALDPGEPAVSRRAIASAARAQFLWENGVLERVGPNRRARAGGQPLLKLTSGSTGASRALAFTDAQMLADGRQICSSMGIGPDDVNFAVIPFGHSYGLGNLVVPLLEEGTAVVCGTAALPHAIAAEAARWRPTVFPAVPAILSAMADSDVAAADLESLRLVISAGAPLSGEAARRFHARFGKKIHGFYGSSETGGIAYDREGDATLEGRSVGTPLDGVRLAFGEGGRFTVASAAVFTLGNRRRQGREGAHRTGDLGQLNEAGELVLAGRAGAFVKIQGRRFSLSEVESALRRLPGIRDAFVVLQPGRSDRIAAVAASDLPAAELRAALREHLAPWKIPRKLVAVREFPVNARGKPDRRRLFEALRDSEDGS